MFEFVLESNNLPFSVSIALMLVIALLEGAGSLLGAGISGLLDGMLPDIDLDIDLDAPDIDGPSGFTKLLGWLRIGQVPALMILIVFLTSFGLIGLALQSFCLSLTGVFLPGVVAVLPALLLALPVVRCMGGVMAKILPKDETYAVSETDFIGRVATVTLGRATKGNPTRAKLKDRFGTTHYVMVEPDSDSDTLQYGQAVILVARKGAVFSAILTTSESLTEK